MKIKLPGILILISAFFYLIAIIFSFIFENFVYFVAGFLGYVSLIVDVVSVPLLITAGLIASKRKVFGVLLGVYAFLLIIQIISSYIYFGWSNVILNIFLPINFISSVSFATPYFPAIFWDFHIITLFIGAVLNFVLKVDVASIEKRSPLTAPQTYRPPALGRVNLEGDAVSQIQRLAELLKEGLLTQGEFEAKKKQILGL